MLCFIQLLFQLLKYIQLPNWIVNTGLITIFNIFNINPILAEKTVLIS